MIDNAAKHNVILFKPSISATLTYGWTNSKLGTLLIASIGPRVCYLAFQEVDKTEALKKVWGDRDWQRNDKHAASILEKIEKHKTIALLLRGTEFQMDVWQALLTIPAGETSSYQKIANQVQRPSAVRAVGSALGANPILWIVPCHRVLRSDGQLGGYAGGLDRKQQLLNLEKNH